MWMDQTNPIIFFKNLEVLKQEAKSQPELRSIHLKSIQLLCFKRVLRSPFGSSRKINKSLKTVQLQPVACFYKNQDSLN